MVRSLQSAGTVSKDGLEVIRLYAFTWNELSLRDLLLEQCQKCVGNICPQNKRLSDQRAAQKLMYEAMDRIPTAHCLVVPSHLNRRLREGTFSVIKDIIGCYRGRVAGLNRQTKHRHTHAFMPDGNGPFVCVCGRIEPYGYGKTMLWEAVQERKRALKCLEAFRDLYSLLVHDRDYPLLSNVSLYANSWIFRSDCLRWRDALNSIIG